MSSNAAVAANLSDILMDLGNIPANRVRSVPKPGTATMDDLLLINGQGGMCELVDCDIPPGLEISLSALFGELDRTSPVH